MSSQAFQSCSLIVSRQDVKRVKDRLESYAMLDKRTKIRPLAEKDRVDFLYHRKEYPRDDCFVIPVHQRQESLENQHRSNSYGASPHTFITLLETAENLPVVGLLMIDLITSGKVPTAVHTIGERGENRLDMAIDSWLRDVASQKRRDLVNMGSSSFASLDECWMTAKGSRYTLYPPMILLPATSRISNILEDAELASFLLSLYESMSSAFNVTHIAQNAPIRAYLQPKDETKAVLDPKEHAVTRYANVLRSPSGLIPLYGDFGPALGPDHTPTTLDFESAFWCTSRQNDILQTWAPRYTMFSRGNISEKSRVLSLPSLTREVLGCKASNTTAVDLFAGIGYFAFSYAKVGVGKIICWEINPWSVEGLIRGAAGNGWDMEHVSEGHANVTASDSGRRATPQVIVFEESNVYASARVRSMRGIIPPVRHVNCGYLPSSKYSWSTAVEILDPGAGGWIHAHENIAKEDIEERKLEIVGQFREIVASVYGPRPEIQRHVSCNHLERVKSYAPGVIHCVLDIAITPIPDETAT